MKIKRGSIGTYEGEWKDIEVDSKSHPVGIGDLFIGLFAIGSGIVYLMKKAFVSGCDSYIQAEYDTLEELGLFKSASTDTENGNE